MTYFPSFQLKGDLLSREENDSTGCDAINLPPQPRSGCSSGQACLTGYRE